MPALIGCDPARPAFQHLSAAAMKSVRRVPARRCGDGCRIGVVSVFMVIPLFRSWMIYRQAARKASGKDIDLPKRMSI
ncbi:MAG: hypothetical protein IPK39_21975 [Sulfuritalea sp.]|nr:hypothetical protein [Sulfuritalea sp.]